MKHVMHDLETLGTVAGCSILSIGAVEFDPQSGMLGREFYTIINTSSCEEHFLSTSEDTKAWWQRQSAEARELLDLCATGGPTLPEALNKFNDWLSVVCPVKKELRLYGNGADFDNPILMAAYDAAKVRFYGQGGTGFYGGRCYRTYKNLDELLGPGYTAHKARRTGVHHNALDDAKTQAVHLMEIVDSIRHAYENP